MELTIFFLSTFLYRYCLGKQRVDSSWIEKLYEIYLNFLSIPIAFVPLNSLSEYF